MPSSLKITPNGSILDNRHVRVIGGLDNKMVASNNESTFPKLSYSTIKNTIFEMKKYANDL